MKDRTALAWLVAIPVLVVAGLIVATIVVSISWGVMIHEEAFFCSEQAGRLRSRGGGANEWSGDPGSAGVSPAQRSQ